MNEYESAFEGDSEVEERRRRRNDLTKKVRPARESQPDRGFFSEQRSREEGRARRLHYLALNAYDRHKELINNYYLYHPGATKCLQRDASGDRTDHDVIRENHRFVWSAADQPDTWEKALAKRYHDKLFKEYCICDLTFYKLNKVAMRWRVEKEVISGKGQFICGSKQCDQKDDLRSWEVNFAYTEHGEKKNCLVKLRLCPKCSRKLNYHRKRKEVTKSVKRKRVGKSSGKAGGSKGRTSPEGSQDSGAAAGPSKDADIGEGPSRTDETKVESAEDIWKQPVVVEEEKSVEEEFDEFLSDLFL